MRNSILFVTLIVIILTSSAAPALENDLEEVLRFEGRQDGESPRDWGGGPMETIHLDTTIVHGGRFAVRLERDARSSSSFTSITKSLPLDITGQWLEMRGFLRTEEVTEFAGLWMREDGPAGMVQFDNMQGQGLKGTTEWTEYSIRLPLDPKARELYFGVLVSGQGKVWADDLELLVDGKPFNEAPERVREKTILDTDQEFVAGSGVSVTSLTEIQIANLALLGKVWGFLKYHHPGVASGDFHWDFDFFRVLPQFLEAENREAALAYLVIGVDLMGVPESCDPCAQTPDDAHLLPRIDWIRDADDLGPELSAQLQTVYEHRFVGEEQFYLSTVPNVKNPIFDMELPYMNRELPDVGYRLLALMRVWNIIEYWFPYRNQIDADWEAVLHEFVPRMVAADTWDSYRLELLALAALIQDGHANMWGELQIRPPVGDYSWPVEIRFVEGAPTVAAFTDSLEGPASGLEIGDVITAIDGRPVESLIEEWSPYYCASNLPTMLKDIGRSMHRGPWGPGTVEIDRDGNRETVTVDRTVGSGMNRAPHDRKGDTFQLLSEEVAYIKLSSIQIKDVPGYLERAEGTRGLVIDIRNYPGEFVVFALGPRLITEPTAFTRFTNCDPANPGAFIWTEPLELSPEVPQYQGKVVILVNESSMSQAEYTAMALRAGPQAMVVGSTTAGADGNVSFIPLPGGLRLMMSGIGVFYPDKTPTQRVGIVPDVVVNPTRDGIREGRDEVLEEALRQILGAEGEEKVIRKMAARP